jgi:ribosome-interacting GTPase 1
VRIQLLDVPGIISGASSGKGRGREVLAVARNADLVIILSDATKRSQFRLIAEELEGAGVRLNKHPPNVSIRKTHGGGVHLLPTVKLSKINEETARSVANALSIHNAEISVHEDISLDELVDAFRGNRVYIPAVFAVNKIDAVEKEKLKEFKDEMKDCLLISAEKDVNLNALREEVYRKLGFIRVFLKPQGGKVDMKEPLVLKAGSSIRDICERLHKDFLERFRYAVAWGASAKHTGQRVGLSHKLLDGDIVSIIKK